MSKTTKKELRDYKLLAGKHVQRDHTWEPTEEAKAEAEKTGRPLRAPSKEYSAGEVVPSETDLVELFGSEKFQYIGKPPVKMLAKQQEEYQEQEDARREPAPPQRVDGEGFVEDDLTAMTVADLRAYAADKEVDLHGCRSKDDIIKAIRNA